MSNPTAEKRVSHVKRFMFGWSTPLRDGDMVMHERADGMWVRYDDLLYEVERLMQEKAALPDSIQEALNSGDGTYRP